MFNIQRVDGIYSDPHEVQSRFVMHYGDLTDATNMIRIIQGELMGGTKRRP